MDNRLHDMQKTGNFPERSMDMDAAQFRKYGHEIIDWIADYLAHPERYPVLAQTTPGAVRDALPKSPPERPESIESIMDDVGTIIVPGLTHWNHPDFFAYFATTASGPGILGELLMAAFNANAMLWRTSPAATELEEVVLDWLRQMLGLPAGLFGMINDTASVSSLVSIAAAREAADAGIRVDGMPGGSGLRLYTSEQSHSSIEKAAIVLGIGQSGVRKIPVDGEFRMRADILEKAIGEDVRAGLRPFCVVATVGTTSTTSVDPVGRIADIAVKHGLWLHVDGAYGGMAGMVPGMQWVLEGVDRADSFVVNPHKWLFVPSDLSVLFSRKPEIIRRAFSLVPEYLRTKEDARVRNYMDYGIQLGRRFRALKLWMVIRYFGAEGVRERLGRHIAMARRLREWIESDDDFEIMAPSPFSVVCFRYAPRGYDRQKNGGALDALNEKLLDAVNATGESYISHTKLNGKYTLRIAIGNLRTTQSHVERAWELVRRTAQNLAPATA